MAYDGLLCGIIVKELQRELISAKIEKIQQPESDEIVMQINTNVGRKKLLFCLGPSGSRVHYTKLSYENPKEAPNFCMLLRKHIQGGRISKVYQVETERIICFEIETVNEMGYAVNRKLIAETMGKHSNLVLVDAESGRIIDSIKRISIDVNRVRQILPGLPYVAPPSQGKLDFWTADAAAIEERIVKGTADASQQPGKALMNAVQGLGPALAEELACGSSSARSLAEKVMELRGGLPMSLKPTVYCQAGVPKDVHAVPMPVLAQGCELIRFDEIGDALDWFFSHRLETNRVMQKSAGLVSNIGSLIDKQLLKKQRLLEEIKAADEADVYRIKGELIHANMHLIKPGAREVIVTSFYDGSSVKIDLDERLSAAKNAQAYFKKYTKGKGSKKEKLIQLEECEKNLIYLESARALAGSAASYEELELIRMELHEQGFLRIRNAKDRNRRFKPKPRRFITKSGFEYVVGRNNTENDFITFKLGSKTDLWFHTKDIPGSHVVLFLNGGDYDADTVYEVASVAAYYSKARDSENVPVDYVPLRHVKKPSGAKPGMVIFTNNRTVYVDPRDPEADNEGRK